MRCIASDKRVQDLVAEVQSLTAASFFARDFSPPWDSDTAALLTPVRPVQSQLTTHSQQRAHMQTPTRPRVTLVDACVGGEDVLDGCATAVVSAQVGEHCDAALQPVG